MSDISDITDSYLANSISHIFLNLTLCLTHSYTSNPSILCLSCRVPVCVSVRVCMCMCVCVCVCVCVYLLCSVLCKEGDEPAVVVGKLTADELRQIPHLKQGLNLLRHDRQTRG